MTDNVIHVLLVEDETTLSLIIKETLEEQGFSIQTAQDGTEGLNLLFSSHPDIVVADIMMPKMDGFEMIRHIRQHDTHTPVIFLTARTDIKDVVHGFEIGANDYLRKPFGMQELIIRIKALTGRAYLAPDKQQDGHCYRIGNYQLDTLTQQLVFYPILRQGEASVHPEVIPLSHREAEILHRLCRHQGEVVSIRDILIELWGNNSFFNTRSLHVFITKLRHKLAKDPQIKIINVRGIGYKLIR